MMRAITTCTVMIGVCLFSEATQGRSWIIPKITEKNGEGWVYVPSGNYEDGDYWYASGQHWRRAYWKFDFPDVPSRPALYWVEQWVPDYPEGVTMWSWLPIEVNFTDKDAEPWPYNYSIPWIGDDLTPPYSGQNHQWIGMPLDSIYINNFQQAGPGPHTPTNATCDASTGGEVVWMRKGSWLYTKWDFPFAATHAATALRITEVNPPPEPVCDPATLGGPIDLRCMGNNDPLYSGTEFYGNGSDASVDGNSLGAEGYVAPTCFTANSPLSPGLPTSGQFTAHLPTGDVGFRLRFDGMNSLKWRDDDTGTYARSNVYTLNGVAGREFVEGKYSTLYLLTVKGGGTNGQLLVEAVYADDSVEPALLNLYDWFNEDGVDNSLAIGNDGQPRRTSTDVLGFRRLDSNGAPGNGGDHGGAFPFVQTVALNKAKVLKQIRLSIGDQPAYNGELCVLAATLELGCNMPVFDVVGPSGNPAEPDGAVDQLDFAVFQSCYTGSNDPLGIFDRSRCGCLDTNGDGDIDTDDYARFAYCASGPGIPADPVCQ